MKWTVATLAGSIKPVRPIEDIDQMIREVKDDLAEAYMRRMQAGAL